MLVSRFICTLGIVLLATSAHVRAEETSFSAADLKADIQGVRAELARAEVIAAERGESLLGTLAAVRREVLALTAAALENRLVALEGGTPTEVVVPTVAPDPDRAQQVLEDLLTAEEDLRVAEAEASGVGGLIGVLAQSTVATHKLSIAHLKLAYYQAAYGIALPTPPVPEVSSQAPDRTTADATEPLAEPTRPEWADPNYPEIDYNLLPFIAAFRDGDEISGWWRISHGKAALDDSPTVNAWNHSQYNGGDLADSPMLLTGCNEGLTALVFLTGSSFMISDYQRGGFDVEYRIDGLRHKKSVWDELTTRDGTGLFGGRAKDLIRQLIAAEKLYIRVTESDGEQHDATFDLSGGGVAFEAVAKACGWTAIALQKEDYEAVQRLLRAAGYDPGPADGRWGSSSRNAMRAFQKANGLDPTGAPDRRTLDELGWRQSD